jgi:4-hydroxybenzoate polyprenyltransferase
MFTYTPFGLEPQEAAPVAGYVPFGLEARSDEAASTAAEPADTTGAPQARPPGKSIRERLTLPADSAFAGWLGAMPDAARAYVALSRLDRPVGIWLLVLPCWIGIAFTRLAQAGLQFIDLLWAVLFLFGAVAMRGAGCTWNDITDRKIDAGVARTAGRPLPSGQVRLWQAGAWLCVQLLIGFLVWLVLPRDAKIVALLAIPLVAAYPFMKRLTWWPQAWLGATMNWGVLVAAATVGSVSLATVVLWLGLAAWTIAYDTIYALQDREDDALVGVKSTARLFGEHAAITAFCFHLLAAAIAALAGWFMGADRIGALTALIFLVHGGWQYVRLRVSNEDKALEVFKSNVWAGAILAGGFGLAALLT